MKKKIPFDIKYRPQIDSGEYKLVDKNDHPVRIICWDKQSEEKYGYHIVALIKFSVNHEESTYFTLDGKARKKDKDPSLFIVYEEDCFSELEQKLIEFRNKTPLISVDYREKKGREIIEKYAQEILNAARKVIEDELEQKSKKYIQDTASINDVENHLKNLLIDQALRGSHAILDSQRRLREEVDLIMKIAKSEVCKNIPKLKKCPDEENHGAGITQIRGLWSILFNGYYITLEDFCELPKEE